MRRRPRERGGRARLLRVDRDGAVGVEPVEPRDVRGEPRLVTLPGVGRRRGVLLAAARRLSEGEHARRGRDAYRPPSFPRRDDQGCPLRRHGLAPLASSLRRVFVRRGIRTWVLVVPVLGPKHRCDDVGVEHRRRGS